MSNHVLISLGVQMFFKCFETRFRGFFLLWTPLCFGTVFCRVGNCVPASPIQFEYPVLQPASNSSQMQPHCIVVLPDSRGMNLLLCYDNEVSRWGYGTAVSIGIETMSEVTEGVHYSFRMLYRLWRENVRNVETTISFDDKNFWIWESLISDHNMAFLGFTCQT